jgi:putative iron-regulated protein
MHSRRRSRTAARSAIGAGLGVALWMLLSARPLVADSRDRLALAHGVAADYARLAAAGYDDAVDGAKGLDAAVHEFLAAPSASGLERARRAWIAARIPYTQTEAFRFSDGPIDAVEGLINSWPIDENLIDYVEGESDAGIINHPDRVPAITSGAIVALNEKDGEKNITTGFHAIEFLLWGQDLSDDGPGRRPFDDYAMGRSPTTDRRREYLRLASSLLVAHLESVAAEWRPGGADNYRARFLRLAPDLAIARMLKGVGILAGSELAGERLTVPYETKEQEDEHSCFSDNTQQDLLYDAIGIDNVLTGRYVRPNGEKVEGRGVIALVASANPALARQLAEQSAAAVAAARLVPAPFDRAILGRDEAPGRVAVKALINALRAEADSIARVGAALGVKLTF